MRITHFGIILCAFLILIAVSCAGFPSAKPDVSKTPSASQDLAVITPVSTEPSLHSNEAAVEANPKISQELSTPQPAETQLPPAEVIDPVPSIPPGERLLYFYPEPEPLIVLPLAAKDEKKEVPTPVKEPVKQKTESALKSAVSEKPEPKTDLATKTPEKAVADDVKSAAAMPGIWQSEPVAPAISVNKPTPTITPSRRVDLVKGQTLEALYPGSGWVYLGDVSAQNGLSYQTRKLDKTDTLFTFKALKPGTYLLEFTRFDVLEDSYASDVLSVTVADALGGKSEKVRAPDYRNSADQSATVQSTPTQAVASPAVQGTSTAQSNPAQSTLASGQTQNAQQSMVNPLSQTASTPKASAGMTEEPTLSSQPVASATNVSSIASSSTASSPALDAASLLEQARKSLAGGDAGSALVALDNFFAIAADSLDEGLFLRGQAYEANGASRDIRKALATYETLISAYPDSARWPEADARARYIKQFYLKIR
jgi:hypothetical protein